MKIKLTLVTIIFCFLFGNLTSQNTLNNPKISALETAEIEKKIELIKEVFHEDAIILHPDGLPIAGKEAIHALYDHLWSRTQIETLKYITDSVYKNQEKLIETGRYIFVGSNQVRDTLKYNATFLSVKGNYKLYRLAMGNKVTMESRIPKLIKPTGKYKIGRSTYYYDQNSSGNGRHLSFQIWYPAQPLKHKKASYQSTEVVSASAKFLEWPLFAFSFLSMVESNSYPDAPAIKGQKFPIIIYNHGYGGFSSVYQTVCEDLASNGYIVVSLGHENESALLLVDEEIIIVNDQTNEFYASRSVELNGSEINALQSVILNSDDDVKVKEAYQNLIKLSPLHNESTRLWTSDTKMAIEKLRGLDKNNSLLKGSFDFSKIGVFGHSVGGASAGQLAYDCKEVKAAINLDGFQFGDLIHHRLKIPFMFVSSNASNGTYLRVSNLKANSESSFIHAVIQGFSHGSFTDLELFKPDGEKIIEPQRDLIRLFFNKYLKAEEAELIVLEKSYPIIRFKEYKQSYNLRND